MISELLHALGVPGSIVVVASVAVTLFHGRHLLAIGATVATWARFVGFLVLVGAVAYAGLIPGVNLSVAVEPLWHATSALAGAAWEFGRAFFGNWM
ncbi:hypothetical protein GCM10009037_07220 [Halarchaeum grantii]|uniref:Uncharacterized protein n=1 Tax=Halarchaeum grantii TaxID=1193105 RepID=A0A830F772_9EURY|nr:hypothetical protein [Halarchaeum grantii]GGL26155.1 hypothetical protein GCM10009037_07220 [Halarchaeum grantii]